MGTARQYHSNGIIGRSLAAHAGGRLFLALPSATPPVSTRRQGRSLNQPSNRNLIPVTGGFVHIRTGPGKERDPAMTARAGDILRGGFRVRIVYH